MTAPSTQELFRELVFKIAPSLIFAGVHTYTVAKDNGDGTLDLTPAPKVLHGPRLRVDQWAAPGMRATLSPGDKVLIVFIEGDDKIEPVVIGHMPLRLGRPIALSINATSAISVGPNATTVNVGSASTSVNLAGGASPVANADKVNTELGKVSIAISALGGAYTPAAVDFAKTRAT